MVPTEKMRLVRGMYQTFKISAGKKKEIDNSQQ